MQFSSREEGDSPIFQPHEMNHLNIRRRRCQPMQQLVVGRGPRRCSTDNQHEERNLLLRCNTNAAPPALPIPLRTTLRRKSHQMRVQIWFKSKKLPGTGCTTRQKQEEAWEVIPNNTDRSRYPDFTPLKEIFETLSTVIEISSFWGAQFSRCLLSLHLRTETEFPKRRVFHSLEYRMEKVQTPVILVHYIQDVEQSKHKRETRPGQWHALFRIWLPTQIPVSWRYLCSNALLWPLSLGSQYDIALSSIYQCLLHTHLEHAERGSQNLYTQFQLSTRPSNPS
jgi:hypothetical protein